MNCLFLGYNNKKTRLIKLLKKKGFKVSNIQRKVLISDLKKNELFISFGYRKIISSKILRAVKRPIINIHLSYLPYNRGAHPNFWSIMENTPSGVSIHEIDKGVDTGPIIYKKKIEFNFKKNKNLTFKSTYKTLFREAENLFEKKLDKLISYKYKSKKQKKRFSLHKKKDLPKSLKNWNKKILYFKNNF